MRITAKVDYAVRAMCELAGQGGGPVRGERLRRAQAIPQSFLENILHELKRAGLVATQRGVDGGYRLAKPADEITVADIIRAVEGPLADVRGSRPDSLTYDGAAVPLRDVWLAVRANLRAVLEHVTVADIAEDHLPELVPKLLADPEAVTPPLTEQRRRGRGGVTAGRVPGSVAARPPDRAPPARCQAWSRPQRRRSRFSICEKNRASTTMPMTRMTIIVAIRPGCVEQLTVRGQQEAERRCLAMIDEQLAGHQAAPGERPALLEPGDERRQAAGRMTWR